MSYAKQTYAILGVTTALLALVVDQLLWTVTILTFGPGVIIGISAPLLAGGVGVLTGASAIKHHGPRLGSAIVVANCVAIAVGIWWGYNRGAVFGLRPSPAFLVV